jgi:hypothetical protein
MWEFVGINPGTKQSSCRDEGNATLRYLIPREVSTWNWCMSHLGDVERRDPNPSLSNLVVVAKALGVTLSDLSQL